MFLMRPSEQCCVPRQNQEIRGTVNCSESLVIKKIERKKFSYQQSPLCIKKFIEEKTGNEKSKQRAAQ